MRSSRSSQHAEEASLSIMPRKGVSTSHCLFVEELEPAMYFAAIRPDDGKAAGQQSSQVT